jgi:hypothetical protein
MRIAVTSELNSSRGRKGRYARRLPYWAATAAASAGALAKIAANSSLFRLAPPHQSAADLR